MFKKLAVFTVTLVALGWLTSGYMPVEGQNLAPGERANGITYDGTNVTVSSGQLLLPDGAVGAPSMSFTSDPNTGMYNFGAEQIGFAANGAIAMRVTNALVQMYNPVRAANGTASAPAYTWSTETDVGLYRIGADNIGMALGGALVMDWEDTNAAGAGADLVTISSTLGIMDGSDTVDGLKIALTNANHTGTGNAVNAFEVSAITGDAQATEIAAKLGAGFDIGIDVANSIVQDAYRQSFDAPCLKVELADYTTELVTDAAVNQAICEGTPKIFTYRLDGAQASPFIVVPGAYLDLDNDGAENEGVEVILSDLEASTQGWAVVGTSPAMYVKTSITIASVSGTDNFYFGWRLAEAFVDDLVLATYDTYGVYHINDNAGNLQIQTGDDTVDGTDEEDQVADWGDAETHVLEVRLATDGTFTFYIDGLASTITNASGAAAAGDVLYPVIGFLNDADADTEMHVNYIEVGEVQ